MADFLNPEAWAKAETEAAIEAASRGANPDWMAAAHRGIKVLAHRRQYLTSDDLWVWLQDLQIRIEEPRAMGAIMCAARKDALIKPTTTFLPSARPACHRRPQRVWQSLIYDHPEAEDREESDWDAPRPFWRD